MIDWRDGISADRWDQLMFEQQYGDMVRVQTRQERKKQGKPEKLEVTW